MIQNELAKGNIAEQKTLWHYKYDVSLTKETMFQREIVLTCLFDAFLRTNESTGLQIGLYIKFP